MIRILFLGALGAGLVFTRGNGPGPAPAEWLEATQAETVAGFAARYDPGLMGIVLRNRGLELAEYHRGAVSLMRRGDLRRDVWIWFAGRGWLGPYLVADCAGRADFAGLVKRDRIVELSAREWFALGLPEDQVLALVSFSDPWPREVGPWPI